jgi:hypothetical protein
VLHPHKRRCKIIVTCIETFKFPVRRPAWQEHFPEVGLLLFLRDCSNSCCRRSISVLAFYCFVIWCQPLRFSYQNCVCVSHFRRCVIRRLYSRSAGSGARLGGQLIRPYLQLGVLYLPCVMRAYLGQWRPERRVADCWSCNVQRCTIEG